MLSELEKSCSRNIVDLLSDEDLKCLCQTVTQNSVVVSSRREAIDAIIQYSESATELLHRRKITKDHLKAYAMKFSNELLQPSICRSDKAGIVKLLLDQWGQSVMQTAAKKGKSNLDRVETDSQEVAVSFITWFYRMLNSTHASSTQQSSADSWGPQHFWKDAKLLLKLDRPNETCCDEILGASEVSQSLRMFVTSLQGLFNPNFGSEGIFSDVSSHGLLAIKSAGTVHRNSVVIGLYEQAFGLIQDPSTGGNWKVKDTKLHVKLNLTLSNALSYQ